MCYSNRFKAIPRLIPLFNIFQFFYSSIISSQNYNFRLPRTDNYIIVLQLQPEIILFHYIKEAIF